MYFAKNCGWQRIKKVSYELNYTFLINICPTLRLQYLPSALTTSFPKYSSFSKISFANHIFCIDSYIGTFSPAFLSRSVDQQLISFLIWILRRAYWSVLWPAFIISIADRIYWSASVQLYAQIFLSVLLCNFSDQCSYPIFLIRAAA